MPFGRRTPLETLALPGAMLAYKYSQFRQRRREAASRRVTERELSALHHKIDKLLNKLEESEPEPPTSQEDECVICINARATMQTSPCGHRVVCRRCFVKTIQSAVAQRLLPLRCVICRARINRLTNGSGTWRLQESASNYSVGTSRSWTAPSTSKNVGGVRVAQSASLYSMSSGSSNVSGISYASNRSNSSEASCSTNNSGTSGTSGMSSLSLSSKTNNRAEHNHRKHDNCGSHCLGAIPRNPQYSNSQCIKSTLPKMPSNSAQSAALLPAHQYQQHHSQQQNVEHQQYHISNSQAKQMYVSKRNTPKSASYSIFSSDMHRLPPIKEFRSPSKASIASPSRIASAPRLRFASYTSQKSKSASSTSSLDTVPLLGSSSTSAMSTSTPSAVSKLGMTAKVAPIKSKSTLNTRALVSPTEKPAMSIGTLAKAASSTTAATATAASAAAAKSTSTANKIKTSTSATAIASAASSKTKPTSKTVPPPQPASSTSTSSSTSRNPFFIISLGKSKNTATTATVEQSSTSKECNKKINEKMMNENKRNEYSAEKRKKEEKLRLKAEKEARKEEKRQAKEEKKRGKKDGKYFSLLCDNNKTDSKTLKN